MGFDLDLFGELYNCRVDNVKSLWIVEVLPYQVWLMIWKVEWINDRLLRYVDINTLRLIWE